MIALVIYNFFPFFRINSAQAIGFFSDLIVSSWPSANTNHTLTFMLSEDIPASGKIIITPQDGKFTIMNGFDYTDIDLATSSLEAGPYLDRNLASSSSAAEDGVSVVASTTHDSIEITLNSTQGIAAGTYLQIEIGTNAAYGDNGDRQILNASTTGSYKINIQIFDENDNFLDRGETYIVMIEPVALHTTGVKIRSNGQPTGVLAYNTTQTIMSLNTNYAATCRYNTASGTPYASSTDEFTYTGAYFHSILLTGLTNGTAYTFYIRCLDDENVPDTTDYIISFELSAGSGGGGGGGGGGSGGGGGGGFGQEDGSGIGNLLPYPPLPDLPGVAFSGWAYPLSQVYVLKDGQQEGAVSANISAEFGAFLPDLNQGVYTFGVWSEDSDRRKSTTLTTTFWIDDGTQTVVSGLILPPTIELSRNSILSGEALEVFGQSAPGGTVEIWFYPQSSGAPLESQIIKNTAVVNDSGKWSKIISTNGLTNGTYNIKAKTAIPDAGESDFGLVLDVSIGGVIEERVCAGADLNGDGWVNITDFSILLYWWGTDDMCADQNQDGIVNLTDFSIMMFYWTG
ncbi:MAG: hypothetical protein U9R06_00735 [Patescibacteria group bacterium]|nr:hypothetical protein [Patescibacteria group bacterium]